MITLDGMEHIPIYPYDIKMDSIHLIELCLKNGITIPEKGKYTLPWYDNLRDTLQDKIHKGTQF